MQLTFDSIYELELMIRAMGYVRRDTAAELTCGDITLRGSEQFVKDLTEAGSVSTLDHVSLQETGDGPDTVVIDRVKRTAPPAAEEVEQPKRKRRTKAEMEAEETAQTVGATTVGGSEPEAVQPPQVNPLDNLKPEAAAAETNSSAHAEIAAMVDLFDGTDTLTHINEGRDFIAKHGFMSYNETMTLADVPANITTHTPEQASRHRAAMAWKAAQLAKG
jgi:hypothetical protein